MLLSVASVLLLPRVSLDPGAGYDAAAYEALRTALTDLTITKDLCIAHGDGALALIKRLKADPSSCGGGAVLLGASPSLCCLAP